MKTRALLIVLLNVLALSSSAMDRNSTQDIARLPQLKSSGMAKQYLSEGKKFFDQKEYKKALEQFQLALLEDPSNYELNYLIGQASYLTGNYTESIFAYQRALALNPSFTRANLEIARAYQANGEWSSARSALEKAKSDPNIPTEVRQQAERLLVEMGKGQKASISGALVVGQSWDTNASQGSGPTQLHIDGQAIPLFSQSTKQADNYQSVSAVVNYDIPLAKHGLAWKTSGSAQGQFYNKVKTNQNQLGYFGTGIEWASGKALASLMASVTILYLNDRINKNGLSGSAHYNYQFNQNFSGSASYTYGRRHHFAPKDQFYSKTRGYMHYCVLGANYMPDARDIFNLQLSYLNDNAPTSFSKGSTNIQATKYGQYQGALSYSRVLAPSWTGNAKLAAYQSKYRNINTSYAKKRKDDSWSGRLGATYKFNQYFSLEAAYRYKKNDSNIKLFSYNSNLGMITLTTLF